MGNIKLKDGLCIDCDDGKLKPCIGKRDKALCVNHYQNKARAAAPDIPKVAENRKILDKIYFAVRAVFLKDNTQCAMNLPGCKIRATEVHHTKGRDSYYLVVETWLPGCCYCHRQAEDSPNEAKELKISQDRLTKNMMKMPVTLNLKNSLDKLLKLTNHESSNL